MATEMTDIYCFIPLGSRGVYPIKIVDIVFPRHLGRLGHEFFIGIERSLGKTIIGCPNEESCDYYLFHYANIRFNSFLFFLIFVS